MLSTAPLPAMNQPESVAVGVKTPVRPIQELAPSSALPLTTPEVTSTWPAGIETSLNDCTKVLAAIPVPDQ